MEMRLRRMFVALLGILAVAAFAPQLASADAPGAINGTVTNAAGVAISGVRVEATNVSTGNNYFATTAFDGTYTLGGVTPGGYQVFFRPDNGQGQDYVYQYYPGRSNAAAAQPVSVTAGLTTSHVDATLATGATVSGKVTDAATGAAVSGVGVYVYTYAGGGPNPVASDYAITDSTGAWSLTGYPTGTYEVEFSPQYGSNYASQYYNGLGVQDAPTPLALIAGSTTSNINAALAAGGQISGTVTDGMTGAPAQGISVYALDSAGDQFARATTDANGRYTLSGLSPSASYRVEFYPGYGSPLAAQFYATGATLQTATPVAVTVGQTTPNINETLSQGASISGVVTDAATGYPIGNVRVNLFDDAGHAISLYNGGTTEPDGSYDVTNIPPGSYKLEFSAGGVLGFQYYNDATTLSAATAVTVSAGQAVPNINAALADGGTLEGVVTDATTGQGLADTYVGVLDAKGHYLTFGFTDPNGRYEIHGIAPGTYYVQAYPSGQGVGDTDQPEFYGGTFGLAGATPVTITADHTTSGIDFALPAGSATPAPVTIVTGQTATPPSPAPTPAPPVAQATQVIPGPPTLFGGSVSGLGKGKPVVKFRLRSGSNGAHKLRSFRVKLPAGLAFVGAQLRKGVKVTGGGKVTEKVTGGQLVVTLGTPASAVTVSISSPALKVTRKPAAHPVRVVVTVTPVNGTTHLLSFTVKNPN
ncbi:MAG: carboxypeptidase regulatory-like domain-containing protein [Solirubrobacteraceae bacterium]